METLDRARFAGRVEELAALEAMLDGGGRLVLLHGPGGIGKSALLRELARRAAARGRTARILDGRDLLPVPGEIERAVGDVGPDTLLVFDSFERIAGIAGWLRGTLLPGLPAGALVVLAGRRPPAAEWFRDGWEHMAVELELKPLPAAEARALLTAYGADPDAGVVRWAQGWPLALSLAASRPGPVGGDLLRTVVARIGVDEGDRDALAVAALARQVDEPLLDAVLGGAAAMEWLRGLSFAERVGAGVSLHDLVRRAVRAELEPRQTRDLRRRIADHIHARAVAGEPRMLIDLTELIDDRALRWGFGAEGSVDYRVDGVRAGDREALAPWYATRPRWWRDIAAFLDAAPDRVVLARDRHDALAGVAIAVTLADAPAVAREDAVLGPWLEHARRTAPGADVLLWRDATDLRRNTDPASPVVSLMNTAAILDSGIANVRWSYIPVDPANQAALEFSGAVSGRTVPELAVEIDGRVLHCHVIDHGEGGMLGQLRDLLYGELQISPRPAPPGADAVRDALRNLHRPAVLAASPLATGTTPQERAESVRARLRTAADEAFGDTADERLLRDVLERGYLAPGAKHQTVADELHLSRTAYFRRLRQASERVAEWISRA